MTTLSDARQVYDTWRRRPAVDAEADSPWPMLAEKLVS
jgi:hypothetical protein